MAGEPSSTHDVFLLALSESGTDLASGQLLEALRESRIRTFTIEDEELLTPRGDEITPALVTAIEASKVAIVVVTTKDYRYVSLGRWKALAYIVHYYQLQRNLQHILSVYYLNRSAAHTEPLSIDDTFEEQKKVAAQLLDDVPFYNEVYPQGNLEMDKRSLASAYRRGTVQMVSKMLNGAHLHVAVYPVGLESRLEEVWQLTTNGGRNIGFYGMQGIGKSTLARAVYNRMAHEFDVSCFLHNIREDSNTHGLVGVQKMLLSQISGETDIPLENVSEGVLNIKDRLLEKDVLLILDDVDSLEQLEALGRGPGWQFTCDSVVMITTRNKHLLRYHGNDMRLYDVLELNDKEALELLSHRAFEHGNVDPRYTQVLNRAKNMLLDFLWFWK